MFENHFFTFLWCASLKYVFLKMSHSALMLQILFWSPGEGRDWIQDRLSRIPSQVGNPRLPPKIAILACNWMLTSRICHSSYTSNASLVLKMYFQVMVVWIDTTVISEGLWQRCIVKMTNFLDIIHRPILIQNMTFQRLEFVSVIRYKLLCWAQSIELVSICRGPRSGDR
jgi:hypothetical protein